MKRLSTADRILELCQWQESGYVRELRVRGPLSQREIAEDCGVTQSAVARWEMNERRPRGRPAIIYHKILTRLAAEDARANAEVS